MAKTLINTITFMQHQYFRKCSVFARLLYGEFYARADDPGIILFDVEKLKGSLFPGRKDITEEMIVSAVYEMAGVQSIFKYEAMSKKRELLLTLIIPYPDTSDTDIMLWIPEHFETNTYKQFHTCSHNFSTPPFHVLIKAVCEKNKKYILKPQKLLKYLQSNEYDTWWLTIFKGYCDQFVGSQDIHTNTNIYTNTDTNTDTNTNIRDVQRNVGRYVQRHVKRHVKNDKPSINQEKSIQKPTQKPIQAPTNQLSNNQLTTQLENGDFPSTKNNKEITFTHNEILLEGNQWSFHHQSSIRGRRKINAFEPYWKEFGVTPRLYTDPEEKFRIEYLYHKDKDALIRFIESYYGVIREIFGELPVFTFRKGKNTYRLEITNIKPVNETTDNPGHSNAGHTEPEPDQDHTENPHGKKDNPGHPGNPAPVETTPKQIAVTETELVEGFTCELLDGDPLLEFVKAETETWDVFECIRGDLNVEYRTIRQQRKCEEKSRIVKQYIFSTSRDELIRLIETKLPELKRNLSEPLPALIFEVGSYQTEFYKLQPEGVDTD